MIRTLIRDARHWRTGEPLELAIEGDRIRSAGPPGSAGEAERVVQARGAVLAPGLVDVHVHLREPGQSAKETIATGTRAAAAGGFTAVACMPNTRPVVDNPGWIAWIRARAAQDASCRVHPIAAVTVGQRGECLCELLALAEVGAVAFSDDGHPIASAEVMRRALEYAAPTGRPIVCHEEDPALGGRGQMHEGPAASRLGLRGLPAAAEVVMARRDVELAALTGGRVHLAHLSAAGSFEALRDAKRRGLPVTGETCPHYWMLTDEAVEEYDTHAKVNPPLRGERDRLAVIEAIRSGVVDCLATDHAPHTEEEKRQPFDQAPFGMVGLETALALTITGLVEPGHLSLPAALELWTEAPRRIFGLPPVRLQAGDPADLVLLDPEAQWTVDPARFFSKGRNTPFAGRRVTGKVLATWCGGEPTHEDEALAAPRPAVAR
jgi:dihydroorotase